MLDISAGYGGDLLKFGGDALLLFFEGDSGPRRAVVTGQAMQRAMSRFAQVQTSQGVFPLRMSIGMGTGPILPGQPGLSRQMRCLAP
jgi:class 3 adenylate cyclase